VPVLLSKIFPAVATLIKNGVDDERLPSNNKETPVSAELSRQIL